MPTSYSGPPPCVGCHRQRDRSAGGCVHWAWLTMIGPSRSRAARAVLAKRIEWLSIRRRSAAARSASMRRQSAEVMAIGFSR